MTAPAPPPASTETPASGAASGPADGTFRPAATPAAVWRRARGVLLALAVLATAGIVLAALDPGGRHGRLDPRSADPSGTRAVAALLRDRGVSTRIVTTADAAARAAGPGTTLLVARPDLLGPRARGTIRSAADLSGGRIVLLAPGSTALRDLAPSVHTAGASRTDTPAPGCALPAARTAGRADTGGGLRYTTTGAGAAACYPDGGRPTLLVLPSGTAGGDTVVAGSAAFLLNEDLAREGNASLALHLLGSRPELVWYLPSPAELRDGAGGDTALTDLIPAGWHWALLQLLVAAVLAALWRARRLGPLVTERLPVAIRASEATEGRARLYRRADARERAATVLRAAARERLAPLVGVPRSGCHDPAVLVPAVSARAAGPDRDAAALLFGLPPASDAALVALADHLDALEREVRSS
ncbi:DUF4350 domain-containing protein [Streptomyces globosus]|uniref:DUF4350 domain-containing protein n=1 Tax=Streptomyces globosus TaxID=68209 RepID=UPI0037F3662F